MSTSARVRKLGSNFQSCIAFIQRSQSVVVETSAGCLAKVVLAYQIKHRNKEKQTRSIEDIIPTGIFSREDVDTSRCTTSST